MNMKLVFANESCRHLRGQNTITRAPTTEINPPTRSPTSGLAEGPSNAQPIRKDMTMKKPPYHMLHIYEQIICCSTELKAWNEAVAIRRKKTLDLDYVQ
mmetsp:Transcript_17442/g.29549  ORF Transcript_17442/g.29549 Transcript_17442/m.29549 type:complete len:99 (+) Transcript_17442:2822-3118(+)